MGWCKVPGLVSSKQGPYRAGGVANVHICSSIGDQIDHELF